VYVAENARALAAFEMTIGQREFSHRLSLSMSGFDFERLTGKIRLMLSWIGNRLARASGLLAGCVSGSKTV